MARWMERLAGWAQDRFGRAAARPVARSHERRKRRWGVEGLERREVLSTTAVHPFMIIPAKIDTVDQSTAVGFQLAPGQFAAGPKHTSILLGLYTEAAPGNPATTSVTGLVGPTGTVSPVRGSTQKPMLVSVRAPRGATDTYSAGVSNSSTSAVGFGLDAFLAGDLNGDLKVTNADLSLMKASYGSYSGDSRYNPAADINQDGRVGRLDYLYLMQNLGAHGSYVQTPATVAPAAVAPTMTAAAVTTTPAVVTTAAPVTLTTTPALVTTTSVPVATTGYTVTPISNVGVAPVVATQQAVVTSAPATTQATSNVVLVPTSSATTTQATTPTVVLSQPTPTYYPTVQYSGTVPSGPSYTSVPTTAIATSTPTTYYTAPTPSTTAYSYSYTPNGTTPVYLTPVQAMH